MVELYGNEDDDDKCSSCRDKKKDMEKYKRKKFGISCMLSAVIRRPLDTQYMQEDTCESAVVQSLKSLRSLIFNPQQEWRTLDPSIYLSPFLDVVQSDDIPDEATGVALSAVLKILKLEIFEENTPGVKDAMNSIVTGITSCQLEKIDPMPKDAVMMRILQVLMSVMRHPASILLTDEAVCTIVNTCFQVVQQSASRGDLLQQSARYTTHESIQIIFSSLPDFEVKSGEGSESDSEDFDMDGNLDSGYGIRPAVDIFHFLCSLLNVVEMVEAEGSYRHSPFRLGFDQFSH